jgi:hypothetical protein
MFHARSAYDVHLILHFHDPDDPLAPVKPDDPALPRSDVPLAPVPDDPALPDVPLIQRFLMFRGQHFHLILHFHDPDDPLAPVEYDQHFRRSEIHWHLLNLMILRFLMFHLISTSDVPTSCTST